MAVPSAAPKLQNRFPYWQFNNYFPSLPPRPSHSLIPAALQCISVHVLRRQRGRHHRGRGECLPGLLYCLSFYCFTQRLHFPVSLRHCCACFEAKYCLASFLNIRVHKLELMVSARLNQGSCFSWFVEQNRAVRGWDRYGNRHKPKCGFACEELRLSIKRS